MKRQLAWILGGATVGMLAVGGTMIGCSSNGGGMDAGGMDVQAQDQTAQDVNNNPDMGTPMDAGADCKDTPSPHPEEGGTIFCGYNDAGNTFYCPTGQQCCLGGSLGGGSYAPEGCFTWGGGCPNPPPDGGTAMLCNQPSDCTANGKSGTACCLQGATPPTAVMGCSSGDLKSSDGTGSVCEQGTTCSGSGDLQLCETNADCPSAHPTCTGFRWKIYELGFCM